MNYFLTYLAIKMPACDYEVAERGRGRDQQKQSCKCTGIKIIVDNSLPRDGAYKTVCLGKATAI